MRQLDNVTLLAIDTIHPGKAIASLKRSLKEIKPARTVLLTNIQISVAGIDVLQIGNLKSKDDYSRFCIKELWEHILTPFVLITQHDSWVLDGTQFNDDLYNYDYAGALWLENDGKANGNGGLSWRSYALLREVGLDDFINATSPEDVCLCRVYRDYLEKKYGLKWAPDDLCEQFSFELREPNRPTFGFHGFFHKPYMKTVVIKRSGALGDVVALEPLLRHYHENNYRVVLDTDPNIYMMYYQHDFPVIHFSQFDKGRFVYETIDLDLAYEEKPKQLHLKSYFEKAGVDAEIKNPKLCFHVTPYNRLFKKYIVLHISERDQPYRNIYGMDWAKLVAELRSKSYNVIQIGGNSEVVPGAIEMNTCTINLLLYLLAGAEGFIGIDSGPSNMAVACGIKSAIFFGSVNPEYIYPDRSNILAIHRHEEKVCDTPFCWHSVIGTEGVKCYVSDKQPPCTQYDSGKEIEKILNFYSPKIYDCFIFSNELDLLKIRCEELKDENVTHVLVEATKTFTGKDKALTFNENKQLFEKYNIVHVIVDDMPEGVDAWEREKYQRNQIMRGLSDCSYQDVIILSDADEIPSLKKVKDYDISMGLTSLTMDKYGYYLNIMEGKQSWDRARIMPFMYLVKNTPEEVRNSGFENKIANGGWHFSYLGGVDAIMKKFDSFSHQEEATQKINNRQVLEGKLAIGQSLWGSDLWEIVPIGEGYPTYIRENELLLSDLIY